MNFNRHLMDLASRVHQQYNRTAVSVKEKHLIRLLMLLRLTLRLRVRLMLILMQPYCYMLHTV